MPILRDSTPLSTPMKDLNASHSMTSQISLHPHQQQRDVVEFSKKNNIHIVGYSLLGRKKSDTEIATVDEPVVQRIAKKYGKTPAQVLLSWGVQSGWSGT
ncbi:hypothetical protein BC938DRAFT_482445 [Jimgerdemannia flammicorona]|uniref:NADP-dependent oxidoreductase domain-containing protein n=1 Tax=Jimgerdemannia flammicorona TaxID=994334 RepID=A0A433QE67_9FUNG|nr:hypothetical protein BC938DRAFT_482445 [Jimgerdemannia flammicorona]